MKNICVVQARMGSTRLPGKVLLPLNGHTVIGEVLERCRKIPGIDQVITVIPDSDENIILMLVAHQYGHVLRGSENDVLSRYMVAANCYEPETIMRITGDCPLISPELCGAVLQKLIDEKADYASNIEPRTFPKGMDCEVFTFETLKRAYKESDEREHVTTWMRRADIKRVNVASPWKLDGRLTLDNQDDYQVIRAAFETHQHLRAA